jgi:hypothetical protein
MPQPPDVCAIVEAKGIRHVDGLVLAVDRSAGMEGSWGAVSQELLALFGAPRTADAALGLRFFPDSRPVIGCDATACNFDACAELLVPVAPLTADPASIDHQEDLLDRAVTQNTITHDAPPPGAALAGALIAAAAGTTTAQPTNAVLVTAGEADSCGVDLVRMAANVFQASGVQTFVVAPATLDDFSELDAIADAGGTNRAIRIGPPNGASLADVLLPIREVDYSCNLSIPDLSQDFPVNFDNATMQVALDMNAPFVVPSVAGEVDCGSDLGWYYDDPDMPASINFCPALCDEVAQNRNTDLVVSFGCRPNRP